MTGRASVFSDDRVIKILTEQFIPVADNCTFTQIQRDAEGEFFRKVAEQGHYSGRTKPTGTRQGLYACTSEGELLASINTTRVEHVLSMLNKALKKWNEMNPTTDVPASYEKDRNFNRSFPEGALILRETMRDIPRKDKSSDEVQIWKHNFDHLWIRKEEAQALIPDNPKAGMEYEAPKELVRRIAQYHLVDQVRGEAPPWHDNHVQKAGLTLRVESVNENALTIRLEGHALLEADPTGQTNPYSGFKIDMKRGMDATIKGVIRYNRKTNAFEQFDMVAAASRWGATTYNFRQNDLGPAPIGFAFELIPSEPRNQTPPKFLLGTYFRNGN